MLRLRQVEIFGFKSFAERTRIVFGGSGVAAIVGPNGCGKSNIADSILWVLGEQSAKTLRSGRMADCIFNGTATRPPTNLAEVTLTLYDPESEKALPPQPEPVAEAAPEAASETGETPAPGAHPEHKRRKKGLNLRILPGEVVVTRRLYRDGTSEYYLNGELCRLRDIRELFMGTGLGPESYAIIEQGRVGQILSSRPSDRRALLEEAAGVTKYKTKRRLAEAKLESAHQNLLRVNDILEEITKQLNSLKRQAARARRYQELKAEGTHLHRQLLATQLDALRAQAAGIAAQVEANRAESEQAAAVLGAREQRQAASQQRQYELEEALRAEQNCAGMVLVELERAQTRRTDTLRQQQEADARLEMLAAQRQSVSDEAVAAATDAERQRGEVARLEAQFAAAAAELDSLESEIARLHQQLAPLSGEQGALRVTTSHMPEPLLRAHALRVQGEELVAAAQQALAQCEQNLRAQQRQMEEARESLATAAAHEKALTELVAQRAAVAEPVQKLLLGAGGPTTTTEFHAVGVVADFTELEPEYAPLLEDYLHEELEFVVVETYDAARTGVSLLREQVGGRATFLVDSFGRFPPTIAAEGEIPQGEGIVARVADLVRINGPLGSEAKKVLPRLARTWLVQSAPAAERLARQFPNHFFLSTDGSWYHGRLVSGGVRNGHGSHAMRRELDEAARQKSALEPTVRAAEARLVALDSSRRQLTELLETGRQALLAQEKKLVQLQQQQDALALVRQEQARLAEAAARLLASQQQQNDEEERLRSEQLRLADELTARGADIVQAQQAKLAQEQRCRECEAEILALRQSLVEGEQALRELRAQLEAVRERRHALEVEQARLASDRQHLEITLQSEFGLTAEQLLSEVTGRLAGDALAQAEVRFREIKLRLENIGPVNMMALEEFQECEQRFSFLTGQRDDLMASIADTTNTIREIDAESAKRFEEAFAVINRNFEETFKTLFGGGAATLRLSEAENPADAGIDLICQPPGKR
ncbi:MAG: AAA family ATPase, partial [Acidobacteria bacterium]|nr:AAA family ATPase [Acidobacteriota bacterium]